MSSVGTGKMLNVTKKKKETPETDGPRDTWEAERDQGLTKHSHTGKHFSHTLLSLTHFTVLDAFNAQASIMAILSTYRCFIFLQIGTVMMMALWLS